MAQPAGFHNAQMPHHVCKLNRSIYGLKQAPRAWFDRLSTCLLNFGFHCYHSDPSLFIFKENSTLLLMLIYVDDIILIGTNAIIMQHLITKLGLEFALKDLGALHYFLDIEVHSTPQGRMLTQSKYTKDVLLKANMLYASHFTLMALSSTSSPNDGDLVDATTYRSIVGSLQYLTLTRPDIVYAVNKVCQHMQTTTINNFRDVKRILRYLKGTLSHGITFHKNSNLNLYAFCDADWGGCPSTRRSTTGYCIFLEANCISWSSKKQPTIARSSTEAEYRAMANTTAELTWLTFLFRDIGIPLHRPPHYFVTT
ncbi:uncharacterized protein LOC111012071 [Momordica charantia]|uniref:Uncharacterized protein LOC111012071 n=1 Tax=Momordica charantia TaxID=3673 RepID=A0A6J1CKU6_MOMCH|nr:uncharacterized protein LOC111012071 [Momordica charantia]